MRHERPWSSPVGNAAIKYFVQRSFLGHIGTYSLYKAVGVVLDPTFNFGSAVDVVVHEIVFDSFLRHTSQFLRDDMTIIIANV